MKIIDAHQHFWKYDPIRDVWIDDTMKVIQKDFLPEDLAPILSEYSIDGCVAIQADQSENETNFLLSLAAKNKFIKGVVGWLDLLADNLEQRLNYFSIIGSFKGIRHIAQAETDDFLLRKDVQSGISLLEKYDLTYDILIFQHQLPAAIKLVKQFPKQQFVLDHLAKPQISNGLIDSWKTDIQSLGELPNVYCKLSGMITETTSFEWQEKDFRPFLDVVINAFGIDKVMYGSDWPVCLLAGEYEQQLNIVKNYISTFSLEEQKKILGENAITFYHLKNEEWT